jgi:hypothetical protein
VPDGDIIAVARAVRNDQATRGQPNRRVPPLASIGPMRRFRWILLLVVALLVAAVAAAFFFVRPGLDDSRDRVDARWTPLRPSLITRYQALGGVESALQAVAADRAITKDLQTGLDRWDELALNGPRHTDPAAEALAANDLEALARRARANLVGSARLANDQALQDALAAFDQAVVAPPTVEAYNRAASAYEDERSGFFEGIVAGVLGYDSRPVLILGT